MKIWFRSILWMVAFGLVSACTPPQPMMFGVPQEQWAQLSPEQQQEVIRGYNERQRIQQENAPIESAIDAAQSVARTQIHAKHHSDSPHLWGPPSVPKTPF